MCLIIQQNLFIWKESMQSLPRLEENSDHLIRRELNYSAYKLVRQRQLGVGPSGCDGFAWSCEDGITMRVQWNDLNKNEDCVDGPSARYNGTHSYTQSNILCQRWNSTTPHEPTYFPRDGSQHNYCRNPDNDINGTWCYTTDPDKRWDYCNIEKCPDDSKVIWTNYNMQDETSNILSMHADPEVVKLKTDRAGVLNVSVVVASSKSLTEFWALTGDYKKQRLFYTDYRLEYVGIRSLKQNKTLKRFEGMAHGIETMAYDWVTENLYWTDSTFKWVMAVDKTFTYYRPIHRTNAQSINALGIHSKLRNLYFSTYSVNDAKIIRTDLAGRGEEVILHHPLVSDVTGLTIDMTDDRMYYTDFNPLEFGATVFSASLNGTNRRKHHHRGGSIFWSVAAYLEYIYVTDINAMFTEKDEEFYSVWVIPKKTTKSFRYTLKGKPRAITVLSKGEERSFDHASRVGECGDNGLTECDHICLPRIGHQRECACSLGYQLDEDTKCVTKTYPDEFLLVADAGQGRVFQVPFGYVNNSVSSYSIIAPTRKAARATTAAADASSGMVYWSDKRFSSIDRLSVTDPASVQNLSSTTYASNMVVDPCSKDIFFLDYYTQSIKVMRADGKYLKTLIKVNTTENKNSSMIAIVQDALHRKIYWTDTNNEEGKGQVWRMNYDGTMQEVVYEGLNWPRGITIDYTDRDGTGANLFICEAKTAFIYEVPLEMLKTISNTSPRSVPKQHDLAAHIGRTFTHVLDIKVHDGVLYFIDGKHVGLERFNLTEGPASVEDFGPPEFFSIGSLSVFSRRSANALEACSSSICSTTECSHICVDIGDLDNVTAQCLCNDGFLPTGDNKQNCSGTIPTSKTPDYGRSCPDDITYYISECSDHVIPTWKEPTWRDSTTPTDELAISRPYVPDRLTVGMHRFTYTATNKKSLSTVCSFAVEVRETKCGPPPGLPENVVSTDLSCGLRYGSSYLVECSDESMQIYIDVGKIAVWQHNLTNFCSSLGHWFPFSNFSNIRCTRDPPFQSGAELDVGKLTAICVLASLVVLISVTVVFLKGISTQTSSTRKPVVDKDQLPESLETQR